MRKSPVSSVMVREFLTLNGRNGDGAGVTLGSYLQREMRGKARRYSAGYRRVMLAIIDELVRDGAVRTGKSVGNRPTYYPVSWERIDGSGLL